MTGYVRKARRLIIKAHLTDENSAWDFNAKYNNIADWFILSAWDNRDGMNPLHV